MHSTQDETHPQAIHMFGLDLLPSKVVPSSSGRQRKGNCAAVVSTVGNQENAQTDRTRKKNKERGRDRRISITFIHDRLLNELLRLCYSILNIPQRDGWPPNIFERTTLAHNWQQLLSMFHSFKRLLTSSFCFIPYT